MLGQLAAAAAAVFGVQQLVQTLDAYTKMTGQLTLATANAQEFAAAQQRIFEIAQNTRAPLEAVTSLYARLSQALRESGANMATLSQITETVTKAMIISGATAMEMDSAITQLSQAFASGVLRGDEFNSINEAAPRLMQAFAASIGVGVGALRSMAEQGQLTSDILAKALTGEQAAKIAAEFSKLPPTIGQAMTVAGNALTKFIGELDKGTGASAAIAEAIIGAANAIGPMSKTILDAAIMIGDGFQAALIGLAAFVGARGIAALMAAGPGVIANLQTMAVVLRALAVSAAPAGVAMTGFATAMGAARIAGGALFTMIGGWPTIIAAAAAGLGLLVARLMSASDEAVAAAQAARREMEETNKRFVEARQQYRQNNPYAIAEDIRETEAALARMTGRFSEQSTVVQSTRARLTELVKEYERAGLSVAGLTDTASGARKGIDALNASLKEQAERLRQQQVQSKGGAAGLAEYLTAQLKMGFATKEQRTENEKLIAQIRELEAANSAAKASTETSTRAISDNGDAARKAAQALRDFGEANKAGQTAQQRLAETARQSRDAFNPSYVNEYVRKMEEIQANWQAIVALGPPTAGAVRDFNEAVAGEQRKLVASADESAQQMADANRRAADDSSQYWMGAAGAISDAFGDFVASGLKSFDDFKSSLKRIAQQIISDLVSQFARQRIVIPITTALFGGSGSALAGQGGGILQSLFGGGGGGLLGSIGSLFGGAGGAGSGLFGSIASGVGSAVSGALGTVFGIGGGTLGGSAAAAGADYWRCESRGYGHMGDGCGAAAALGAQEDTGSAENKRRPLPAR
jgi:tape measure domain-containing protein